MVFWTNVKHQSSTFSTDFNHAMADMGVAKIQLEYQSDVFYYSLGTLKGQVIFYEFVLHKNIEFSIKDFFSKCD